MKKAFALRRIEGSAGSCSVKTIIKNCTLTSLWGACPKRAKGVMPTNGRRSHALRERMQSTLLISKQYTRSDIAVSTARAVR